MFTSCITKIDLNSEVMGILGRTGKSVLARSFYFPGLPQDLHRGHRRQPIRELNLRGVEGFLRFPKVV